MAPRLRGIPVLSCGSVAPHAGDGATSPVSERASVLSEACDLEPGGAGNVGAVALAKGWAIENLLDFHRKVRNLGRAAACSAGASGGPPPAGLAEEGVVNM